MRINFLLIIAINKFPLSLAEIDGYVFLHKSNDRSKKITTRSYIKRL